MVSLCGCDDYAVTQKRFLVFAFHNQLFGVVVVNVAFKGSLKQFSRYEDLQTEFERLWYRSKAQLLDLSLANQVLYQLITEGFSIA